MMDYLIGGYQYERRQREKEGREKVREREVQWKKVDIDGKKEKRKWVDEWWGPGDISNWERKCWVRGERSDETKRIKPRRKRRESGAREEK